MWFVVFNDKKYIIVPGSNEKCNISIYASQISLKVQLISVWHFECNAFIISKKDVLW